MANKMHSSMCVYLYYECTQYTRAECLLYTVRHNYRPPSFKRHNSLKLSQYMVYLHENLGQYS